ncbi:MAG: hypothetical protein ACN0LA_10740 [Candidatus Longimicrobiales bacterium M2_2A_002]
MHVDPEAPNAGSHGDGFTLLRLDRGAPDPMKLANALAEVRGTPVQDQVLEARGAWGIVAEHLPESEARSLGRALRSAGVECAVGPSSAVVELPAVEPVATVEALPPTTPALIAVAGIEVTTTTRPTKGKGASAAQKAASAAITMTTGLPIRVGRRKRKAEGTQEERRLVFYADLHYRDVGRRARIDASQFDFSCLGDRMVYQAQANLKLLVGDLVETAPAAWLNHGARVLLEGRPIRTMGYRSLDDLDREARWLLTLARSGI